jgi:hypothetical protein
MGVMNITVSDDVSFKKVKNIVGSYDEVDKSGEYRFTVYDEDFGPEYYVEALSELNPEYFTVAVSDPYYYGYAQFNKIKDGELEKKYVRPRKAYEAFLKEDWWVEECLECFEVVSLRDIDEDELEEWVMDNHTTGVNDCAFYLM